MFFIYYTLIKSPHNMKECYFVSCPRCCRMITIYCTDKLLNWKQFWQSCMHCKVDRCHQMVCALLQSCLVINTLFAKNKHLPPKSPLCLFIISFIVIFYLPSILHCNLKLSLNFIKYFCFKISLYNISSEWSYEKFNEGHASKEHLLLMSNPQKPLKIKKIW